MAEPQEPNTPTRFGPVVLAGLMTAALTAVTSARAWVELALPASSRVGLTADDLRADSPLALALALVVLAAWGVVLVSRARTRRIVLVLAVLADLGVLACLARAPSELPAQIRTQLSLGHAGDASPTASYWIALVAAIAGLAAIAGGLRYLPHWPEMSSRYDAPTGSSHDQPGESVAAEDLADRELWKAMDEGRDPTQG